MATTQGSRVLVPVDGSKESLRALAVACQRVLGRRAGQVVAINVQPAMPSSRFTAAAEIRDHQKRMGQEALDKVDRIARREGHKVEKAVVIGAAAAAILREAERRGAGEIIMGTRGVGQIGGLLLGSVAMKVVQLAKVPVTLVK